MKCPGCGKEVASDSFSCPYCGVKKECLSCAASLKFGSSFCCFCGSNLVGFNPDKNRESDHQKSVFDRDVFDEVGHEDDWFKTEMQKYRTYPFAMNEGDGAIISLTADMQNRIKNRILKLTRASEEELADYLIIRSKEDEEKYRAVSESIGVSEDGRTVELDDQKIRQRMKSSIQQIFNQIIGSLSDERNEEAFDDDEDEDDRFELLFEYAFETLRIALGYDTVSRRFGAFDPGFLASDKGWEIQQLLEDLDFKLQERTIENPYSHIDYNIVFIR